VNWPRANAHWTPLARLKSDAPKPVAKATRCSLLVLPHLNLRLNTWRLPPPPPLSLSPIRSQRPRRRLRQPLYNPQPLPALL